jgi:hypothetical protein
MSAQSFSNLNAASLRQSFMLGLNRSPLALPEEIAQAIRARTSDAQPALTALALAGTRSRFARPAPPQAAEAIPEAARALHADPRPVLPAGARRHLQRLLVKADIETSRIIVGSALKRLAPLGMRLHPFDLPRLAMPLRSCGVLPGMAERAFLALLQTGAPAEEEPPEQLFHEAITEENWRSFGKAARARFLAELRSKDAAAGLVLLESCFAQEPAALRSELLPALHTGLSAGDRTFLEGLEKNRAESVRAVAAKLLSLLPGTDAYAERLNRAMASFKVKPVKMLRGKRQIVFTHPGGARMQAIQTETFVLLENVTAEELARRLDMTLEAFLEALPDGEDALLAALVRTAVAIRSMDVIAALVPRLSRDAIDILLIRMPDSAAVPEVLEALLGRFMTRLESGAFPRVSTLAALHGRLAGPLPLEMAKRLLSAVGWRDYLDGMTAEDADQRKIDTVALMHTAMLLPAACMPAFLAAIEPLPPAINRKAREFAHFVLALPAPAPAPDER